MSFRKVVCTAIWCCAPNWRCSSAISQVIHTAIIPQAGTFFRWQEDLENAILQPIELFRVRVIRLMIQEP